MGVRVDFGLGDVRVFVVAVVVQVQYSKTTTHMMCTKLDFPPVSSAIIWARQVSSEYLQQATRGIV